MVGVLTAAAGAFGGLLSGGLIFEVGRRVGTASTERSENRTQVEELEATLEERFNNLDRRLTTVEKVRESEHQVVLTWLGRITEALNEEEYDVERPEAVKPTVQMDSINSDDESE